MIRDLRVTPLQGNAVILFADLVGSSELSEYTEPGEYSSIVRAFHDSAFQIYRAMLSDSDCAPNEVSASGSPNPMPGFIDKSAMSPRGDEICLILGRLAEASGESAKPSRNDGPVGLREAPYGAWVNRSVLAAFKFALALKTAWLLSPYNVGKRILPGRQPLGLAIGIHLGPVEFLSDRAAGDLPTSDFIGYEINLAKRIEGTARTSRFTSVMTSAKVHFVAKQALPGLIFETHPQIELKGIYGAPQIFELIEVVDFEHYLLKDWRPGTTSADLQGRLIDRRLFDTLGVMVGHHAHDSALRFLTAVALQYCNEDEGVRRLVSEGLVRSAFDAAMKHYGNEEIHHCHEVLIQYAHLKGFPPADELLAKCARALNKPPSMDYMRRAYRPTEFFNQGSWTKE